ncbi:DUF4389 domain-containing protein [Sulfurovum sp.]|uniref:DUF4389 domain-containing protein n=1 Tax=Sulfurovum sp. TaxID=1969726 RepID=UPI0025F78F17|nr:DUF4389 domain-containing protein [Sulfurovum sp.]
MKNSQTYTGPKPSWERVLYTILYLFIERFISLVLFVIAVAQFVYSFLTKEPNEQLLVFNSALAQYMRQIIAYVGFNTDEKPWPMGKWPKAE